jgi:GNAT superfamily N-acetyltransferase
VAFSAPEPLNSSHDLNGFDCGRPALDNWLTEHALANQKGGTSRVFVTVDDDGRVVGFYALSAAQVEPEDATARLMKGQPKARPVPVVLLGRLAVDTDVQGRGLGQSLLRDALRRCLQASEDVGIRALTVHAKDEATRAWYERNGFDESPTDPLHLILLLKDLRKTLDAGT